MKLSRIAQIGAIGAIAALALTACAANEAAPRRPADPSTLRSLSGELAGSGASSQEVAVQAWTAGFQTANPDVTINYDPAGSGTGRESFQAGAVDSPAPTARSDRRDRGRPVRRLRRGLEHRRAARRTSRPSRSSSTSRASTTLNLDAATIAGLFAGTITNWNDPAIAALNDGVDPPRSGGDACAPLGRLGHDRELHRLPVRDRAATSGRPSPTACGRSQSGEAAQGTSGVVSAVAGGNGTVGYADASRAAEEGLATAAVQVGDEFVEYSPEAAAAIVDASPLEEGRTEGDLAIEIDRTTEEAGVYPIVLVSYMIALRGVRGPGRSRRSSRASCSYVASPEGQQAAAEAAGSAPISESLREQVNAAIDLIVTE